MPRLDHFRPASTLKRIRLNATSCIGQLAYTRQQMPDYAQDLEEVEQTSRLLLRQVVALHRKVRGRMSVEDWRKHALPRRYVVQPANNA